MNEKQETSENAQPPKNSFLDVSLKGLQKNPTKPGKRADLMRKTRDSVCLPDTELVGVNALKTFCTAR